MIRKFAPLAALALLTAVSVAVAQTPEVAETPVEAAVEATTEVAEAVAEVVEEAVEAVAETPVEEAAVEAAAVEVVEEAVEEPVVEESVVVEPAVEEAPSVDTVIAASPVVAGPVCCPIQIVASRATLSAKRAYRCSGPPVETMACVDNPADCTCTLYQIPLCIPCCCVGEPQICNARTGLLGRGHVDLVWPCGFTAKVVFLVHGGAKIIYVAG